MIHSEAESVLLVYLRSFLRIKRNANFKKNVLRSFYNRTNWNKTSLKKTIENMWKTLNKNKDDLHLPKNTLSTSVLHIRLEFLATLPTCLLPTL